MNKTWIKWTQLKPGEKMKYQSREFRKDIPDDQKKTDDTHHQQEEWL